MESVYRHLNVIAAVWLVIVLSCTALLKLTTEISNSDVISGAIMLLLAMVVLLQNKRKRDLEEWYAEAED